MAKIVVRNGYFGAGSGPTDYSAYVAAVTLDMEGESVDVTTLDSAGWKAFLQGMKSANITIDFVLDADLSGLEKTVWDIFNHATTNTLAVEFRKSSDAIGTTNPEWQATALVTKPINPDVKLGERLGRSVTWPITGAVTRATS